MLWEILIQVLNLDLLGLCWTYWPSDHVSVRLWEREEKAIWYSATFFYSTKLKSSQDFHHLFIPLLPRKCDRKIMRDYRLNSSHLLCNQQRKSWYLERKLYMGWNMKGITCNAQHDTAGSLAIKSPEQNSQVCHSHWCNNRWILTNAPKDLIRFVFFRLCLCLKQKTSFMATRCVRKGERKLSS